VRRGPTFTSKKIKGVLPLKFAGLPECITEKDDETDVGED
jgi:hypothetical protein